jgi:hypothetical protein
MVNNYTFARNGMVCKKSWWRCSSFGKMKCRATAATDTATKTLLKINNNHNHDPPKYYVSTAGHFVKLP